MDHFRQETEACRIIMEKRQNYQQSPDNAGSHWRQRAEADFRIEFFFKLPRLDLIEFHRRKLCILFFCHAGQLHFAGRAFQ